MSKWLTSSWSKFQDFFTKPWCHLLSFWDATFFQVFKYFFFMCSSVLSSHVYVSRPALSMSLVVNLSMPADHDGLIFLISFSFISAWDSLYLKLSSVSSWKSSITFFYPLAFPYVLIIPYFSHVSLSEIFCVLPMIKLPFLEDVKFCFWNLSLCFCSCSWSSLICAWWF